jgi:hypothetical protein
MEAIREYEIRLYKDDGALSMVMSLAARSDIEAELEAHRMVRGAIVLAHIWRDEKLVGSVLQMTGKSVL